MNHLLKSIFLLYFIFTCGCLERVKPKESDLDRYKWMKIFTPELEDFEGIVHDLDTNYYAFSFKSKYDNFVSFFHVVDSLAIINNWIMKEKKSNRRIYIKKSTEFAFAKHFDKVILTYNLTNKRIKFERMNAYDLKDINKN